MEENKMYGNVNLEQKSNQDGVEVKVIKKMVVKMTKLPTLFITSDTGVKIALNIPKSYSITCDGDDWRFQREFLACYRLTNGTVQRVNGFYLARDDAITIKLVPLEYPHEAKKFFNSQQEADNFAQKLRDLLDENSLLVVDEGKNITIYRNIQEPEIIEFPLINKYWNLHVYKVPGHTEDSTVYTNTVSEWEIYKYHLHFSKQVTMIYSFSFNGVAGIISTDSSVDLKITYEDKEITGTLSPGTYLFVHPKTDFS